MNLVEIKASFDPSNADQLSAAISFLSAIGVATEPQNASQRMASCIGTANATEFKQTPGAIVVDEPEPQEVAEEKPKKRAPRKAKPKTEEQVAEVEKSQEAPKEEAPKTEMAYTLEDIKSAVSAKVKEHREAIKGKLTEYGVPNVVKLPVEKYPDFMNFMESL